MSSVRFERSTSPPSPLFRRPIPLRGAQGRQVGRDASPETVTYNLFVVFQDSSHSHGSLQHLFKFKFCPARSVFINCPLCFSLRLLFLLRAGRRFAYITAASRLRGRIRANLTTAKILRSSFFLVIFHG